MSYVLMLALGSVSARADAGLPCGCNRATAPNSVPCSELEEGDECVTPGGAPGVCDENEDCATEATASRTVAGAMSLAGGLLLVIRRRRTAGG